MKIKLFKLQGDDAHLIHSTEIPDEAVWTSALLQWDGEHYGFWRLDEDCATFIMTGGIYILSKVPVPQASLVTMAHSDHSPELVCATWSDGVNTTINFRNWPRPPCDEDELREAFVTKRYGNFEDRMA
jgi:hypothetical protein